MNAYRYGFTALNGKPYSKTGLTTSKNSANTQILTKEINNTDALLNITPTSPWL